jgi:hypothetical protein
VLVVNRFRSEGSDGHLEDADDEIAARLEACRDVLAAQRGYRDGWFGRNVDDPSLWTLVTLWRDVGSYRRALSSYDVKVGAVPVLSQAIDEPSAYELTGPGGGELNRAEPRRLD